MKRVLLGFLSLLIVLLSVSVWRASRPLAGNVEAELHSENIQVNKQKAIEQLKQSIRFKTISREQNFTVAEEVEFKKLYAWMKRSFPEIDKQLGFNFLQSGSVYVKWPSPNKNNKPALFLAHTDVVPVNPLNSHKWKFDPFVAHEEAGYIYGRGSMDDKASVVAMLLAVEECLKSGIQPTRDIYLAFGHDEELGGMQGAHSIAEVFTDKGLRFEWIIDEGGFLNQGDMIGVDQPIAFVGIAEKGFVNYLLTVYADGGHSSVPPKETAFQILSKAVYKLTRNSMEARIDDSVQEFLFRLGHIKGGFDRLMLTNLWLFKPAVIWNFKSAVTTNAMIRTTLAPTMMSGGIKSNVLPSEVTAIINSRVLPGDTIESVRKYIEKQIDDVRVQVTIDSSMPASEATKVSSVQTLGFNKISTAIKKQNDKVKVLPYLLLAGTDTRHYMHLSDNIYRFSYHEMSKKDVKRVHGVNERIHKDEFINSIQFYVDLMVGKLSIN